jgi:hypothetical protein
VYAVLATLEALADIGDARLSDEIQPDVMVHVQNGERKPVSLYARLLKRCTADPDGAVQAIDHHLTSGERLVRICAARLLPRILAARPAETLEMMRYVLRRQDGHSAEHQNVRRAVTRQLTGLIGLLDSAYSQAALDLLRTLAGDEDVHIRRAVCDALSEMVAHAPEVAIDLIETFLLHDRDHFIQERTWKALRQLMDARAERAEELCARMIEIA